VIFPFYYLTLRWWETLPGRAVMVMATALAVTMTLIFLSVVLDFRLPVWARLIIYALMAVALWVKLAVLVYVSRPGYRLPSERTEETKSVNGEK
jgi:Ca2+/Na+ antiporter